MKKIKFSRSWLLGIVLGLGFVLIYLPHPKPENYQIQWLELLVYFSVGCINGSWLERNLCRGKNGNT